MVASEQDKSY